MTDAERMSLSKDGIVDSPFSWRVLVRHRLNNARQSSTKKVVGAKTSPSEEPAVDIHREVKEGRPSSIRPSEVEGEEEEEQRIYF
jgi:hypothetical protein